MAQQSVSSCAALTLARRVNLLLALVAPVACRPWAFWAIALVDLGVGVTQLDGNVADQFVLETNGLDARDGLDDCGLSVSDVADGTDVDGRLPRNNLGCEGGKTLDVEVLGVCLRGQGWSLDNWGRGALLQGRLGLVEEVVVGIMDIDLGLAGV